MARSGYAAFGAMPRGGSTHVQQRTTVSQTGTRAASQAQFRPDATDLAKKEWRWKRTRHSQQRQQDPDLRQLKQANLETLELAAKEGHIDLKYLDEAGFCLDSPVSYSYSRIGTQKREQVPTRGNRMSILGLWQAQQQFEYALAQGGFEGESYIKVMDWVAQKAALSLEQTGRFTVVVQDNCSIHKRELVR